jgi:hypothetical protein
MLVSFPFLAGAETYQIVAPTERGTLSIGLSTEPMSLKPSDNAKLKIDFLNPQTKTIQQHIDYIVKVTRNGETVFGPIPLTHTSTGTVTIPVQLKERGEHQITIEVLGILFQPMPSEKALFSIMVGEKSTSQPKAEPAEQKQLEKPKAEPAEQKQLEKPKPTLPPLDDIKKTGVAKDKKTDSKQPKEKSSKKTSQSDKKIKKTIKKPKTK